MLLFRSKPIILNNLSVRRLATALTGVVFFSLFIRPVFSQPAVSDLNATVSSGPADVPGASVPLEQGAEGEAPAEPEKDEFAEFNDPFEPASMVEEVKEKIPEPVPETVVPKEISPPTLMIRGAVWGIKPCKAIINDRIYGEGDMIEGTEAKILRIDESGILYEYQEKRFLLKRSQWNNLGEEGT